MRKTSCRLCGEVYLQECRRGVVLEREMPTALVVVALGKSVSDFPWVCASLDSGRRKCQGRRSCDSSSVNAWRPHFRGKLQCSMCDRITLPLPDYSLQNQFATWLARLLLGYPTTDEAVFSSSSCIDQISSVHVTEATRRWKS